MNKPIPERVEEILNDPWLQPIYDSFISKEDKRTALKTMLTKELTETDQQAREHCIAVVKEYEKNIQKLHHEMMGTTHEDCKHLLVYDMHSRLIAIKHILQALSNPPTHE